MPIGVWSTSSTRSTCSSAADRACSRVTARRAASCACRGSLAEQPLEVRVQHVARERRLAGAGHAGDHDQPAERDAHVDACAGCAASTRSSVRCGVRVVDRAARLRRVPQRLAQEAAGDRARVARSGPRTVPGADDFAAAHAGAAGPRSITWSARRMVSSSCSTTTSVLRLPASSRERVEQHRVVARMQADGGLVEDVADAVQVGAELRGEPDALRLAARERRRGAVERQVAQADVLEEVQARRGSRPAGRARSRALAAR